MNTRQYYAPLLILPIIALLGCAHAVSKESRQAAEKIKAETLFKDPDSHRGKTVMLGGIIISSSNTADGTYIEVLEKPLDSQGRPRDVDVSGGRFIIFSKEYLDTAIYSRGRQVTAVGLVMGKELRPLGQIQYPYLLIKGKELHLFKPHSGVRFRFGIGILHTF